MIARAASLDHLLRAGADAIWANYTLFSERIAQPNMTAIGMSGRDL